MVEFGRNFWRSSSGLHLYLVSQDHVHTASEYLPGWTFHNVSEQPVPVASHSPNKKMFLCVQTTPPMFHFVPVSSYHWDCSVAEKQERGF